MRIVLSAVAAACCALAAAGPAAAAPIPVDLRVEGASGRALTADRYYTDGTKIKTAKQPPTCNGSGKNKQLPGATALGTLVDGSLVNSTARPAARERRVQLRPAGLRDRWRQRQRLLQLLALQGEPRVPGGRRRRVQGQARATTCSGTSSTVPATAAMSSSSARRRACSPANSSTPRCSRTTPRACVAPWPARPSPEEARTATTDAAGVAHLTLNRAGNRTLRATLDPNIPSAPTRVCVNADLSKCGAARGTRIWGSRRGEHIVGTAGRDSVLAGAGGDLVIVRGGSVDRVRCGVGSDTVIAGRRDRVARDCEVVRVRGRQ